MHPIIFLFMVIAAIMAALVIYFKQRRKRSALLRKKRNLKIKGKKVQVPFDACEIKAYEEYIDHSPDSFPTRVEMLDSLYDPNRNYSQELIRASVLIFRHKSGNKEMPFQSEPVFLSVESLKLRLDKKRYTYIYIDPQNAYEYFFDLDFLLENS